MLIIILLGDELSKVMNLADELSKDKDNDDNAKDTNS